MTHDKRKLLDNEQGSGSDSDESIRQIKDQQKKKMQRIDLNELNDAQIHKLTLQQI